MRQGCPMHASASWPSQLQSGQADCYPPPGWASLETLRLFCGQVQSSPSDFTPHDRQSIRDQHRPTRSRASQPIAPLSRAAAERPASGRRAQRLQIQPYNRRSAFLYHQNVPRQGTRRGRLCGPVQSASPPALTLSSASTSLTHCRP